MSPDWDEPLFRETADGKSVRIRTFSERQGGSRLAILQLHQPRILVGERKFSFWGGRPGISRERRDEFYEAVGQRPENIFPIHFSADPNIVGGIANGELHGFYRSVADAPPIIEI